MNNPLNIIIVNINAHLNFQLKSVHNIPGASKQKTGLIY